MPERDGLERKERMLDDSTQEGFDPKFEDPSKLTNPSRRGFFGSLAKYSAVGAVLLSTGQKSFAAPAGDLFSMPTGAIPNDEQYWQRVKDQFLVRDGLTYLNSGS